MPCRLYLRCAGLFLVFLFTLGPLAAWAQSPAGNDESRHLGSVLNNLYPNRTFHTNHPTSPTTSIPAHTPAPSSGQAKPAHKKLLVHRHKNKLVQGQRETTNSRLSQQSMGNLKPTPPATRPPAVPPALAKNTGSPLVIVNVEDLSRSEATASETSDAPGPHVSITQTESPVKAPPIKKISKVQPMPALPMEVQVNLADAEELRNKLNVDSRRARLIVEFRTLYGPFKGPEDLRQVSGITDEMVLRWEDQNILRFD